MSEHVWPFVSVVSSPSRIRAPDTAGISFFRALTFTLSAATLAKVIPAFVGGLTVANHAQLRIKSTQDDIRRCGAVCLSQARVQLRAGCFATFARLAKGNWRSHGARTEKNYRHHRTGIAERAPSRHCRRPRLRSDAALPSRQIVKARTRRARQAYSPVSSAVRPEEFDPLPDYLSRRVPRPIFFASCERALA